MGDYGRKGSRESVKWRHALQVKGLSVVGGNDIGTSSLVPGVKGTLLCTLGVTQVAFETVRQASCCNAAIHCSSSGIRLEHGSPPDWFAL